jgi:hypothetical protein
MLSFYRHLSRERKWLMSLMQMYRHWLRRLARHKNPRLRSPRLTLEQLEDRCLPSTYTAASVSELIADINAANQAGGANTITMVAGTTFSLTAVDNTSNGATGLPVIASNDNLTILGNGDTIARGAGTPAFRLFDLASGSALTLDNLTLQGGFAFGSGVSAEGGAILNQGTLTLNGVTVQNNIAQGSSGSPGLAGQNAAGGGIYSGGSMTLEGGTLIQNNQALGGDAGNLNPARPGGNGLGGGLYVSSGSVSLSNVTLSSNTARGGAGGYDRALGHVFGDGGPGGNGLGGALYESSGSVSLSNVTVSSNTAQGGQGGPAARPPVTATLAALAVMAWAAACTRLEAASSPCKAIP